MEHQTLETVDAPEEAPAEAALASVLERGASLLRTLQHAARAARLEAQVVELEAALQQARAGQPQALRAWLEQYEPPSSPTDPVKSTVDQVVDQLADTPREEGWSLYLSHARERLAAIQLQHGTVMPRLPSDVKLLDISSNCESDCYASTDDEAIDEAIDESRRS